MRRHVLTAVIVLAAAGCGRTAHEETQTTVTRNGVTTTTITNRDVAGDRAEVKADDVSGLRIDSDKFKANLEIPGLSFGGDHMDLGGLKLYPGSTVKGMRVHAVDHPGDSKGEVAVTFTSPAAPGVVAQHLADQARRAGFTLDANTTALVAGAKRGDDGNDRFSATLNPDGAATLGILTLTGTKQ